MFLLREGGVTTLWEGLLGWRALVRYWELIRESLGQGVFYFPREIKVIYRGHLNAAGRYAVGRVLNCLEFLNRGW